MQRSAFAEVGLPFIIFTAIWGSTWIVIRDQLGDGSAAMVGRLPLHHRRDRHGAGRDVERRKPEARARRRAGRHAFLGFAQFCVNFNAVYLAERHITSGVVATMFALLLIPSTLDGLGVPRAPAERPLRVELARRDRPGSACCSSTNSSSIRRGPREIAVGIGLTLVGMIGASAANVFQAPR